jgi:HSP20 family protein
MALIRWNPAGDLLNIHSELDRVFDDLTRGCAFMPRLDGNAFAVLPVDVHSKDGKMVVEASVPGFKPEEVSVTVDDGVLTIEARKTEAIDQEDRQYLRQERYSGYLYRQVALGGNLEEDKAEATFKDGVLTVTVPEVRKPEPKRIPVTSASR